MNKYSHRKLSHINANDLALSEMEAQMHQQEKTVDEQPTMDPKYLGSHAARTSKSLHHDIASWTNFMVKLKFQ